MVQKEPSIARLEQPRPKRFAPKWLRPKLLSYVLFLVVAQAGKAAKQPSRAQNKYTGLLWSWQMAMASGHGKWSWRAAMATVIIIITMANAHGQRPWPTPMASAHGQCPWPDLDHVGSGIARPPYISTPEDVGSGIARPPCISTSGGRLEGWMGWAGGCHRKCGTACRAVDTANHTFSHLRMRTTWNHS